RGTFAGSKSRCHGNRSFLSQRAARNHVTDVGSRDGEDVFAGGEGVLCSVAAVEGAFQGCGWGSLPGILPQVFSCLCALNRKDFIQPVHQLRGSFPVKAVHSLSRHVVCKGLATADEILPVFPENFHQNLKNLLTKLILENLSAWRSDVLDSQISLPRLVDLDWRVDIKASSDSVARMAVPTCLLQMKIQENPDLCGSEPAINTVTMEMSKETLDTMLDGLGRIRDQLSAVANK
ncbi:hypothetical protein XELAEV_18021835mg, partial [Xenopus laevis]